jgi:hypothetical protein
MDLVLEAKSRCLDNRFHSGEENTSLVVRWKPKSDFEYYRATPSERVALQDFSALNKGKVSIQFLLQEQLMGGAVRPIQMVTNLKEDVTRDPVGANNVNDILLLDRHSEITFYREQPDLVIAVAAQPVPSWAGSGYLQRRVACPDQPQ